MPRQPSRPQKTRCNYDVSLAGAEVVVGVGALAATAIASRGAPTASGLEGPEAVGAPLKARDAGSVLACHI